MAKGAEAYLFKEKWYDRTVVRKYRIAKSYRIPELDQKIRQYRTIHEAKMFSNARRVGVSTPIIYQVDVPRTTIVYEYIDGKKLKNVINEITRREQERICTQVGRSIGVLHRNGLIHGDLTTSNMILTSERQIYFIDFGLSEHSSEIEQKGVDLHLMRRAFQSTHYRYARECFEAVLVGYREVLDKEAEEVILRIREIERRGRYIEGR
ncbi:MAG: KEOPS complex kinase/ATPase Bud32 [Promethearchaeota archaeon]